MSFHQSLVFQLIIQSLFRGLLGNLTKGTEKTDVSMNKDLEIILNYLREKRGFDYSGYKPSMIQRRLMHRISATGCKDRTSYLRYLLGHSDELDRLVDALTINISRFFRNTLTFEYLAHKILPLIVQEKVRLRDHSLRVWSACCSFGEEPYSIAILIKELFGKEDFSLDLHIFGTDIDKGALKKAAAAVYPFESIKDVKYGLLKRYFTPVRAQAGNGEKTEEFFQLVQEIRDMVSFSPYDMIDKRSYAPPESIFGGFDMVLCRNLLIYFNMEYQDTIFDKLYRSLSNNGYLILGNAEIPAMKYQRHFRRVDALYHVYQKR